MKKKAKINIWIYTAVAGLLIFFLTFNLSQPFANFTRRITNPFLKVAYSLTSKVRIKYNNQTSKEDLNAKVKSLEEERNKLIEANVAYEMLEEENKILREQLRFLSASQHRYLVSNVISRGSISDSAKTSETIIIDKGLKDGIYNGLAVVSGEGVVVGKIVDTKNEIAKVLLTNNVNCKLAATILNDNKTNGVTEGELGLTIKMGFIPKATTIKKDDIVITSGLEEMIPRGLVIGKVLEVKNESNDLWQSAVIEPLVNPDELIIVSILLP